MFTFDGWVTRVAFELHWALETHLHASALDSELVSVSVEETSLEFGTKNDKRNAVRNSFLVTYFILHFVFYLSGLYSCYPQTRMCLKEIRTCRNITR